MAKVKYVPITPEKKKEKRGHSQKSFRYTTTTSITVNTEMSAETVRVMSDVVNGMYKDIVSEVVTHAKRKNKAQATVFEMETALKNGLPKTMKRALAVWEALAHAKRKSTAQETVLEMDTAFKNGLPETMNRALAGLEMETAVKNVLPKPVSAATKRMRTEI